MERVSAVPVPVRVLNYGLLRKRKRLPRYDLFSLPELGDRPADRPGARVGGEAAWTPLRHGTAT